MVRGSDSTAAKMGAQKTANAPPYHRGQRPAGRAGPDDGRSGGEKTPAAGGAGEDWAEHFRGAV